MVNIISAAQNQFKKPTRHNHAAFSKQAKMMDKSFIETTGAFFIGGYAAGAGAGAIIGLAENLHELPAIQLNQCLNSATRFGQELAFASATGALSYRFAKNISSKYVNDELMPYTFAGATAGAAVGMKWGAKGMLKGGIAGSLIGTALGYYANNNKESKLYELLK